MPEPAPRTRQASVWQQRYAQREERAASGVDLDRLPYIVTQMTCELYCWVPAFIHGVRGDGPLKPYGQYGPAIDRLFPRLAVSTSRIFHPEVCRARG